METIIKGTYNVTFVTDYFQMIVTCNAATYQGAVENAITLIEDNYGWDLVEIWKDIDIEFIG